MGKPYLLKIALRANVEAWGFEKDVKMEKDRSHWTLRKVTFAEAEENDNIYYAGSRT